MKENIFGFIALLAFIVLIFGFGYMFGDQNGHFRAYIEEKTEECKYKKVNNEEFIPSYCYDYLK